MLWAVFNLFNVYINEHFLLPKKFNNKVLDILKERAPSQCNRPEVLIPFSLFAFGASVNKIKLKKKLKKIYRIYVYLFIIDVNP